MIHEDEDFGGQRDYKAERDTLIDDIAVLRANNKRLERENESLKQWYQMHKECADAVYEQKVKLERENEKLKATNENLTNRARNMDLNGQIQHDELMACDGEVRYWKQLYTDLTNHIRQKAKANPNEHRYIALVNYIDRLEKGDN